MYAVPLFFLVWRKDPEKSVIFLYRIRDSGPLLVVSPFCGASLVVLVFFAIDEKAYKV